MNFKGLKGSVTICALSDDFIHGVKCCLCLLKFMNYLHEQKFHSKYSS